MARARQNILIDGYLAHITYKCHNSSFYFKQNEIKDKIIKIIQRYKRKYDIPILEWIIMSNHCHFIAYINDIDSFSNFMRQTNRGIAELINKTLNKTGQVIQDRYRSPIIENEVYCLNTIGYIWLNPVRAGITLISKAYNYTHCSLYYRYRGIIDPISDSYTLFKELNGFDITNKKTSQRFARELINPLIGRELSDLCYENMEHLHSIGSPDFIENRRNFRKAFATTGPPKKLLL